MNRLLERYLLPMRAADDVGGSSGDDKPAVDPAPKPSGSVLFADENDPPAKDDEKPVDKPAAGEWKEYEPDANKTDEENAAAKAEHDKTKPAEPDALDTVPPDGKYALTMPEGVTVDQELLDALAPKFAAKQMTTREAQALADEFIKIETERRTKEVEAWGNTVAKWADDAKADKEIGGDKWDTTVRDGRRAVATLGTPAFREYLEASGGGNHPEFIRFASKVGAMIKEDSPAIDGPGGNGKPADPAYRLFPDDAPKG